MTTTKDYGDIVGQIDALNPGNQNGADPIASTGLRALKVDCGVLALRPAMDKLRELSAAAGTALDRAVLRNLSIIEFKRVGIDSPAYFYDANLAEERSATDTGQGAAITFGDPEPWPDTVDGIALLEELADAFTRYVILPDGGATGAALWTMHAHALDAAFVSPLLVLTSPEKRCGKTTLIKVLGALVPRPLPAASISPAAVFRGIEKFRPTLLLDEAESAFRVSEELRAIVNASHDRGGAFVLRTAGEDHEPRVFSTWCAKALALIGKLPGTLTDRAITLPMRRRLKREKVRRLRLDKMGDLEPVRRKAARWATDNVVTLRAANPEIPADLHDRAADNWRPLLAIADAAGGVWPAHARQAALVLSGGDDGDGEAPAVLLLADLRELFAAKATDKLSTCDIVAHLTQLDDRPWPEWKGGRPLTARQLSRLLERFGIGPRTVRDGAERFKGYTLTGFGDAFARYLPPFDR